MTESEKIKCIEAAENFLWDGIINGERATSHRTMAIEVVSNIIHEAMLNDDETYNRVVDLMTRHRQCPKAYPHPHEETDFERGVSCEVCGYLPDPTPSQIRALRDEDC